jgi:hypothetical protein
MDVGENSQQYKINKALNIKARYQAQLLSIPDVVGVGVGFREVEGEPTDEIALIVNVRDHDLEKSTRNEIPSELEGVPVDVKFVGDITAFDAL